MAVEFVFDEMVEDCVVVSEGGVPVGFEASPSEAQSEKLSAVETQIKECLKRYEKLIGSVEKRKRKK